MASTDAAVVVKVAGDLDLATVDQLRMALDEAAALSPAAPIVVDLADAAFADSMSVGTIVRAYNAAQAQGRTLRVAEPSRIVARVLRIMGVYEALTGHAHDSATKPSG